jgi:Spy/CpxP family protein refolding chaperone
MKNALIAALVAVSALTAVVSSADAQPRHWHHHQVCTWRHHHRICGWR